jgi:hypothetical protein
MYGNFTWWQGVVEDRNDPMKLGRCRVRIFGYHTDDKNDISVAQLPWATMMQPTTSAAMNGIGTTPTGPVEGTWVVGFFRDGNNAQEPVIMGTVGGQHELSHKKDPSIGFNDPKGKYPRDEYIGEPDTNRLARGIAKFPLGAKNGEDAKSLAYKRKTRRRGDPQRGFDLTNTGVPKAVAGDMTTSVPNTSNTNPKVSDAPWYTAWDGDANHYVNKYWNEPNPRYGGTTDSDTDYLKSAATINTSTGKLDPEDGMISSLYPYNHVRVSESGHVEEWDDTPGSERLHRYHKTGTFEEIQPDGSRVVKVVANDYEIVAGSKNVSIEGVCNLTIVGDAKVLYRGDLVQEVVGDYHLHVGGEMRTKIIGNDTKEVMVNRKIVINGEDDLFVAKNQVINIADNLTYTVNKNLSETVKGNVDEIYGDGATPGNHSTQVKGKSSYKSLDQITITTFADMKLSTDKNMNINVTLDSTQRIKGNSNIYVTLDQYENIGVDDTREVGGDFIEATGGTHASDAGGNMSKTAPRIDLN